MIIKKPFESYTLEEDKKEADAEVITLKINKAERDLLERLKNTTHYNQDAKVIKAALKVYEKVILNLLGPDLVYKLTDPDRRRPIFSGNEKKVE